MTSVLSSGATHTIFQPIVLVLDVSPSMGQAPDPSFRAPILDLNEAVQTFVKDLCGITHCGVEIMVITFSETVQVECAFDEVQNLKVPQCMTRGGGTNLGGAIGRALDEVQTHRDYRKQTGVEVLQPWLVCVTDGQPNVNTAPGFDTRLIDLVNRKKCLFLPVAVGGYGSYDVLERLSPLQKPVIVGSGQAGSMSFSDFFAYLSQSAASGQTPNLQQNHE